MDKPKTNSKDKSLDERFTPEYAVKPLMDLLNLRSDSVIWECASGRDDLIQAMINLTESTVNLYGSTLDEKTGQGDFFNSDSVPTVFKVKALQKRCGIITNPPYSCKEQWIKRCYEVTQNWALLLPVESLASSKLRTLFNQNNGVSVLFMDSRIDYLKDDQLVKDSSAQFPSCWIIAGFDIPPNRIFDATIKTEKSEFKKMAKVLGI